MLATIGDVLPNFRVYEKIFAGHPALVDALSEVYLDVIKFCSKVKDIFSKASTKGGSYFDLRYEMSIVLNKQ